MGEYMYICTYLRRSEIFEGFGKRMEKIIKNEKNQKNRKNDLKILIGID